MLRRTILVVDDEKLNIKMLKKFLSPHYDILEAYNGQDALNVLQENANTISAVLLDIVMPIMDGYEFLSFIKKDKRLSQIPVIVSSGDSSESGEVRALELGAQDFIAKPYKPNIILHRLENTILFRENAALLNRNQRDELTGLYNKQFFIESIKQVLMQNTEQKYDIVCFTIEKLKLVNEVYGSNHGDGLLIHIAKKLQTICDTNICGRFGSDEFYVFLKHREYSDEFFKNVYNSFNEYPIDMSVLIHAGIYVIKSNNHNISAMCDRAKLAADEHRGQYDDYYKYYDDTIRQRLLDDEFIISNMESAIDKEEFVVYYQPKYNLANEMLAGAEALVRWDHPEKGFMAPGVFIPLFEKNGFISKLDRYVWKRVCQDMAKWMDQGYPMVAVSINISRADIFHADLVDYLLGLIKEYHIPVEYLHLEITESAYTEDSSQIITVINELRSHGFIIEMDDFGSGYSSLNMLADMPIDILKMDMKFVKTEQNNESGKGVISFVVSLAKWLNLAVIAEGVETKEQIALLRSMDCNYVQGFYFARPMSIEQFEALLKSAPVTKMANHAINSTQESLRTLVNMKEYTNGKTMLIVDDIEMNRVVLAAGFMDDYVIEEKANGKDAWDYLQDHYKEVDIVMLDLIMPIMDGFQLLERIRNDVRMHDLPVIITSQGDSSSEQRAMELRANDFVSKPYNIEIVRHRVFNVVAGHRLYDNGDINNKIEEEKSLSWPVLRDEINSDEYVKRYMEQQKAHYDIVRLVDPRTTSVFDNLDTKTCELHACHSVWNKPTRCANCTSLKAFESRSRISKLEYKDGDIYYIISEYIPFGKDGAIVEMVNKIDDKYVDDVIDHSLFYANLKELNDELEEDALTGVKNRRFINNHLSSYLTNARNRDGDIGLAMVDIDSFKELNDTYGHIVGDSVLIEIARILQDNIALSKGDFVCRYGGDEFIVVCRDITPAVFARRMKDVVGKIRNLTLDEIPINATISVGCVNLSECVDSTPYDLINIADQRLYQAKNNGKNQVIAKK